MSDSGASVDASIAAIEALVKKLSPQLAGVEPEVIGGALADLTAMWLACHHHSDGPEATAALRKTMLQRQMELIETLIEPNEKIGLARLREGSH